MNAARSSLVLSLVATLGVACHADPEPSKASEPPAAPVTTPADEAKSALHLGAPIEAAVPSVTLADLAKNPGAWNGRSFTTEGTVSAVCQHAGCWMEIKDDSGQAHIKMAGHKFFVPKTSAGHHARVLASLSPQVPSGAGATCTDEADCRGNQPALDPLSKVELVADGVELM